MTVSVVMPYWGCPAEVPRAVESVLAQTHSDLRLILVADGEDPPPLPSDPRLTVYRLPENRGPYFAQQVAILATPDRLFAPHAADDWSDPDHLELLGQTLGRGTACAAGAVWWHDGRREEATVHRAKYEVGLFSRDRWLALGGHNPDERMGQDTLMMRLLALTGELRLTDRPTYHRVKAPGRLTTAPATRIGSPARNAMRKRNREVLASAQVLRDPEAIRQMRLSRVSRHRAREVRMHAARLADILRRAP